LKISLAIPIEIGYKITSAEESTSHPTFSSHLTAIGANMRTILITGFLGSGKSNVLLSLAAYLNKKAGPEAVVIIENEIGDTILSSKCTLPSAEGMSTVEMTHDCICCTLSGELVSLLEDIQANKNPSWLLIEASSLTHQSIKDIIHQTLNIFEPLSILVIDASRWKELYHDIPMLVGTQAERADFILVNKTETVKREELDSIMADIRKLNPYRPLRPICALKDSLDDFWEDMVAEIEGENLKLAQN
jgi:G3E family GTPase